MEGRLDKQKWLCLIFFPDAFKSIPILIAEKIVFACPYHPSASLLVVIYEFRILTITFHFDLMILVAYLNCVITLI